MPVITSEDMSRMKAFPAAHKSRIMQEIMTRSPVAESNYEGDTGFVKTILKLRADGLRLIDLQPLENACTSVWYKRSGSLLGRTNEDIAAMVIWESSGRAYDVTTVKIWRL